MDTAFPRPHPSQNSSLVSSPDQVLERLLWSLPPELVTGQLGQAESRKLPVSLPCHWLGFSDPEPNRPLPSSRIA